MTASKCMAHVRIERMKLRRPGSSPLLREVMSLLWLLQIIHWKGDLCTKRLLYIDLESLTLGSG